MDYKTTILKNGLRVILLPSASPVVYCGYELAAGAGDELAGEEGLAHFCEHTTFKGTARRNAIDIINALESVGGELNAFTTKAHTVFYAALLHEHIARAVDLLSDIVFQSVYPQQEIDKEVEVICDEIESYNDSPSELIYDEFENIIFEGTPLGHNILGTADHVRQFKTADAKRFTSRLYRPERAVFFASGDVSFDHLVSLLCEALHTEVGSSPLANDETKTQAGEGQAHQLPISSHLQGKIFKKQRDTHQVHVVMGCRGYAVSHPRRIALYLLNLSLIHI